MVPPKHSMDTVQLIEKLDILIVLGVAYLFVSYLFKNKKETGKFFNPEKKTETIITILVFFGILFYGIFQWFQ